MRKILSFLLLFCLSVPFYAQNDYISYSRCDAEDRFEDLQGNYGVLLLSKCTDLVINSTNAKGFSVDFLGERPDGYHEYIVTIDKASSNTPKLEVSRRGIVYKAEFTAKVKPDFVVAYRMDDVAKPIRLDEQTQGNDVHFNATEASVEFTTTLNQLKVKCSPALKSRIAHTVTKSDTSVKVVTVVFPISVLKEAKKKYDDLYAAFSKMEKALNDPEYGSKASDEEWNRMEKLEAQANQAAADYKKLSDITISTDGSNMLSINVGDYVPRQKSCYVVVPILIEKYITECSSFMSQGAELYGKRKYKDARQAYLNALNAKDVVSGMRSSIKQSIAHCDSCMMYDHYATAAIQKMVALRKNKVATQEEVAKYASAASDFLRVLYNYNPDPFYKKYIEKMDLIMETMPLVVKFTVVEWRTLKEGNPLEGVELWSYSGDGAQLTSSITSDRKFKKFVGNNGQLIHQIGTSGSDGIVEVELDRRNLPDGIVFRPTDDQPIKIKYLSIRELFSHAKGTYLKKQFRLRMFTKDN